MVRPSHRPSSHRPSIKLVIHEVQFTKSNHPTNKKILTDIYNVSDTKEFIVNFLNCLKVCLLHEEKSPNVELTLDFAADFAVSFSLDLKEDDMCPLLEDVFQFIFEYHDCQIQLVRLRICQLMNRLLDNMGANASVLEETYNKIASSMLIRLKDSMSSVRTQAVYALQRLQSPNDVDCDIIAAFKFHMMHDPCHEVRRAVIQKIAVTKATVVAVITRLYDIKDTVRKEAYIFINRLNIRQYTIKQRQTILENGLDDRSEMVQDYVLGTLIPNWLKFFNYNFYDFLECIHVERIPDIGIKLLKAIFEKQHDVVLESKIKEMWIINKEISYDKLNMITAVYWRSLAEYVKPSENSDTFDHIFEQILPDLTPFCKYIRGYIFPVPSDDQLPSTTDVISNHGSEEPLSKLQDANSSQGSNSQATTEDISPNKSKQKESLTNILEKNTGPEEIVLVQLMKMCKVYDYSDEMGRSALQKLCVELLESPSVKEKNTVAELAGLLDDVVPSKDTKLNLMAEIITELREPLPADTCEPISDLLLLEAEEEKAALGMKLQELDAEMEIAEELNDNVRIEEIKSLKANLNIKLKILNKDTLLEPGRNVNNDPDTLKKCLTIVVEILRKGNITKMNSTLYSLMQNFIAPTLNSKIEGDSPAVIKNLALQAMGIFCLLDPELAREHFLMFCFNIGHEVLAVTSLKCVFDLLYTYELAYFNIEDPDSVTFKDGLDGEEQSKPNLIILLISLLSSESSEMRKTAVVGLCKMLLAGKIKSPDLVSKLILLWYDPGAEGDPYIRQPLGTFFSMFTVSSQHAPYLFQQAFIPTLKKLFTVEVTDPMAVVDIMSVANLLIEFTRPNFNDHMSKNVSIHNQIAISICEEILTEEYETGNCIIFFKILFLLEINYGIETDFNILNTLALRMKKVIGKDDMVLNRYVMKFKMLLEERHESNRTVSTVDNTLPPETSLGSNVICHDSQLLASTRYGAESDEEVEEEEDVNVSQDLTEITQSADNLVIPGTPESSDSDSPDGFEGFDLPVSEIKKLKDAEFKLPSVPPAKTPFKRSTSSRTPRKTTKTFVKDPDSDNESEVKTTRSARSPTKTPGNVPANKINTRVKSSEKTPTKVSENIPTRTRSSKTPLKRLVRSQTNSPTPSPSAARLTRSAKKRKS